MANDYLVIAGHAQRAHVLKYHCHRLWHAHTEAQGTNMKLVKRENCTVVECFRTEYEFCQSMHGILFLPITLALQHNTTVL